MVQCGLLQPTHKQGNKQLLITHNKSLWILAHNNMPSILGAEWVHVNGTERPLLHTYVNSATKIKLITFYYFTTHVHGAAHNAYNYARLHMVMWLHRWPLSTQNCHNWAVGTFREQYTILVIFVLHSATRSKLWSPPIVVSLSSSLTTTGCSGPLGMLQEDVMDLEALLQGLASMVAMVLMPSLYLDLDHGHSCTRLGIRTVD